MSLPAKAIERIKSALKKFQPIVQSAKIRDVNESDTVVIVTDLLEHMFGYDKYTDITSEHSIRGTYCDLAVKIDDKLVLLIEVKAIGLELKEQHVKQAVDYAANQGVEWVALTNGAEWRVYKVKFDKPIEHDLVVEVNLLDLTSKNQEHLNTLGMLCKEGWKKDKLSELFSIKETINRFTIGAVIMSEPVVATIRREIKRLAKDVRVSEETIQLLLRNEVLKREVLEGDMAQRAQKRVARSMKKFLRKETGNNSSSSTEEVVESFVSKAASE